MSLINQPQDRAIWQCATAFCMAMAINLFQLAVPFSVDAIGGNGAAVGLATGLHAVAYGLSCLLTLAHIDKLTPQPTLKLAGSGIVAAVALVVLVNIVPQLKALVTPAVAMIALGNMLTGVCLAFFWPTIMGWVSSGYEGAELNRRFGRYNSSWSLAVLLSPILAGRLIKIQPYVAMVVAAVAALSAVIIITQTPVRRWPDKSTPYEPTEKPHWQGVTHRRFKHMARVGLVGAFVCLGLARSHLALLCKYDLGMSSLKYGMLIFIMSVTSFFTLLLAGRFSGWHYRLSVFWGAQGLLVLSMLQIIWARNMAAVAVAMVLLGLGNATTFISQMYYGVSGGKDRSRSMSIHEGLLAAGASIGAIVGGFLSERLGSHWPYWFAIMAVGVSVAVQLVIWFAIKDNSDPMAQEG